MYQIRTSGRVKDKGRLGAGVRKGFFFFKARTVILVDRPDEQEREINF